MSWRLRLSFETILRLTPAVAGLDRLLDRRVVRRPRVPRRPGAAGRARGHPLQLVYVRIPRFLAVANRWPEVSVDRRFGTDREERGRMARERIVVLEQRAVPGVRIRH